MENKKEFSPLMFLAALGAGGLSVAFFAFINYTLPHGKGLIDFAQTHSLTTGFTLGVYSVMEIGMIIFALIHFALTLMLLPRLFAWLKTKKYQEFLNNPLTNAGILVPFISLAMSMNVLLASVRYFIPSLYGNLQSLMLPGLVVWIALWVFTMRMVMKLLKISFSKGFEVGKVHFGWLLYPFTLGMVSVTGAGIAAMSKNPEIAHLAFFMLLISGTMGLFLLLIKSGIIFKNQFASKNLPEKHFLPSVLMVVPNVTLYAIIAFRVGHYLHNNFHIELGVYYMIVMVMALAFEVWYLVFGLSLLRGYFKTSFKNEFHVSQWGLICPFVALAVLGSFVYNLFWPNLVMFWFLIGVIAFTAVLFLKLLRRSYNCASLQAKNLSCE